MHCLHGNPSAGVSFHLEQKSLCSTCYRLFAVMNQVHSSLHHTYQITLTDVHIIYIPQLICSQHILVLLHAFLWTVLSSVTCNPPTSSICFRELLLWMEHTNVVCLKDTVISSKKLCPKCVQYIKSNIIQVFLQKYTYIRMGGVNYLVSVTHFCSAKN